MWFRLGGYVLSIVGLGIMYSGLGDNVYQWQI